MTRMNWDRNRYLNKQPAADTPNTWHDDRPIPERQRKKPALIVRCYHCGHEAKVAIKNSAKPLNFKCSKCLHKGYPITRL